MKNNEVLKYVPFLTGVLIFLGYLNLQFYYRYFNINIYEFITTGELVLSFLPILFTIIIVVIILIFIAVVGNSNIHNSAYSEREKEKFDSKLQKQKFYENYNFENLKKLKWYKQLIILVISPIQFILSFSFHIVVIIGVIIILYEISTNPKQIYKIKVFIGVIFGLLYIGYSNFFTDKILDDLNRIFRRNMKYYLLTAEASFVLMFYNITFNYCDASRVLDGKPEYFVSFKYNDSLYYTNNKNVYVGKTQEYIFTYDINSNLTYIFPAKEVMNLNMTKIEYSNEK